MVLNFFILLGISCLWFMAANGSQKCDFVENPLNDRRRENPPFNIKGRVYRLGKTKFFIIDSSFRPDLTKQYSQWRTTYCQTIARTSYLAAPKLISTNAIIARNLRHVIEKNNITYYHYFIGARGSGTNQNGVYLWHYKPAIAQNDEGTPLKYSNVFYRAPRVIGKSHAYSDRFPEESNENDIDQIHSGIDSHHGKTDVCMAFSLPFKGSRDFGWQISWVERICNRDSSAICAIEDCDEYKSLNPHVLTEDKEYYYTEGNWIFANRRFIVNWKPRNMWEARAYCNQYNLDVFAPTLDDLCLVPYLKMWGMVLDTYHFWTSYQFDDSKKSFYTQDGTLIQKEAKLAQLYNPELKGRSYQARRYNVSYIWTYELHNETRCKENKCRWSYYVLAPIYENMHLGTICQHRGPQDNLRTCNFQASWNYNFTEGLVPTAVIEFGYRGSGFFRSAYKQTFGSRYCGDPDRQMIGAETDYFSVNPADVEYIYDYLETYWVVDEGLFTHVGKHEPLCTVSKVTRDGDMFKRELSKVNCDEWHFYLCELVY